LRASTNSLPRFHSTNLNGPVPTSPSPRLSSAVVLPSGAAPAAAVCDRIGRPERSSGSSGAGEAVEMRKVSGSTISSLVTCRVIRVKGEGLFGTLAARSKVKTTSSAVKGEPSWKVTSGRSSNSHTASPTAFHDSASAGTRAGGRRRATRRSNRCSAIWLFGWRSFWYWRVEASSARPSARSSVPAAAAGSTVRDKGCRLE
jgi:hypothetical protein